MSIGQPNGASTSLPYLAQATSARLDLDGSALGTTSTVNDVPDLWGNNTGSLTTTQETATSPAFSVQRNTSYFAADTTAWRLGDVKDVTETRSVPGSPITRTVAYTYNAFGLPASEVRQGGDANLSTTTTFDRS